MTDKATITKEDLHPATRRLHERYHKYPELKKLTDDFAALRKKYDCEYMISDAFKLSYYVARGDKIL